MRGLEVDQTDMYWCEVTIDDGNVVRAAPKDGRGPVRTLGQWYDFSTANSLAIDDQYVYWLRPDDGGVVIRVRKTGSEQTSIPLSGGTALDLGPLHDAGDAVVVATRGCTQILRVPKNGSSAESWNVSTEPNGGGGTHLLVDAAIVYCGNYRRLFRLDMTDGHMTAVATDMNVAGPMSLVADRLYIVDNRPTTNTAENLAVFDPGDARRRDLGPAHGNAARLNYDTSRQRLYWVTGLHWLASKVVTYDLTSGTPPELLFGSQDVMGSSAADADYLYWLSNTAVTRLKKW